MLLKLDLSGAPEDPSCCTADEDVGGVVLLWLIVRIIGPWYDVERKLERVVVMVGVVVSTWLGCGGGDW